MPPALDALFPRRTFRYAIYRFERLYDAERLTRASMPHIPGDISEPLYNAPKPPKSRKSVMTSAQASFVLLFGSEQPTTRPHT
jgi:hypothetical protein